jgi:hypothetical protein
MTYVYFKRYEPKHFNYIALFVLLGIIPSFLSFLFRLRAFSYQLALLSGFVLHYTLLLVYIAIYRLSPFHPLAQYPGPVLPKLSKWYTTYICYNGKLHLWYQSLHNQYGDIVRVGKLDYLSR